MSDSLKNRTTKGMLWNLTEKFSVQFGQFFIGIVLARLLIPSDYGLIGMLGIFLAVSQIFIDSGFSTALIQKNDRTEVDFSTVFYFNFAIASLCYLVLFIVAPLISKFYSSPQLIVLLRVLGLNTVIGSLSVVQIAKLNIDLNFKVIAKANFTSVIIAGIAAIIFAYLGYGVWALVIQNLLRILLTVIFLGLATKWIPKLVFSVKSFKGLFSFGSKLLGAHLIATVFRNIHSVIIGKYFKSSDLGFYTRGKGFADLASMSVITTLSQVSFPVLSSLQNDNKKLISAFKKLIGMSAYIMFPTMLILAIIAVPLIRLLLTDKWLFSAPILQLLCIARVITPVSTLNMNMLNVIGRSDLFLKMDIIKIPILLLALFVAVPYGVIAIAFGQIVSTFLSYGINTYYSKKLFNYGFLQQLNEMKIVILLSILITIFSLPVSIYIKNDILRILITIPLCLGMYIYLSFLFKIKEFYEVKYLVKKFVNRYL